MDTRLSFIFRRRSVRKYTDQPVPEALIEPLLEAAMAAPSATNRKPWAFVVVDDPDQLCALRRALPLSRYGAPLAIVACGDLSRAVPQYEDFWIQDVSAAMENLLLAAPALGLGGCWIGVNPVERFAGPVCEILGLPEHIRPLGVALIGYPANDHPPRTQYDPERVHRNRW